MSCIPHYDSGVRLIFQLVLAQLKSLKDIADIRNLTVDQIQERLSRNEFTVAQTEFLLKFMEKANKTHFNTEMMDRFGFGGTDEDA